jgi:hypothetical protein
VLFKHVIVTYRQRRRDGAGPLMARSTECENRLFVRRYLWRSGCKYFMTVRATIAAPSAVG